MRRISDPRNLQYLRFRHDLDDRTSGWESSRVRTLISLSRYSFSRLLVMTSSQLPPSSSSEEEEQDESWKKLVREFCIFKGRIINDFGIIDCRKGVLAWTVMEIPFSGSTYAWTWTAASLSLFLIFLIFLLLFVLLLFFFLNKYVGNSRLNPKNTFLYVQPMEYSKPLTI